MCKRCNPIHEAFRGEARGPVRFRCYKCQGRLRVKAWSVKFFQGLITDRWCDTCMATRMSHLLRQGRAMVASS